MLVRAGTPSPPHRLFVMRFCACYQGKSLRRAYRLKMQINIKSGPPKMPGSRALYIQNILDRSTSEPGKLLMVKKILVPTYEHPDAEW